MYKLVSQVYKIAPGVLTEHGKTKNPFPNVKAFQLQVFLCTDFESRSTLTLVFSSNTTVSLKQTTTLFSSVSPEPLVSFHNSSLTVQLELLLSDQSPFRLRNGPRSWAPNYEKVLFVLDG